LAQTLIKLTAPGMPDIYQGTEYWDLDPENRAPVAFESRKRSLDIRRQQTGFVACKRATALPFHLATG
jgi:(1->4)-alpha-D-glucan 1-alpha-D-glucosylmutase